MARQSALALEQRIEPQIEARWTEVDGKGKVNVYLMLLTDPNTRSVAWSATAGFRHLER